MRSYVMPGRGGGNTLALVRQNIVKALYVYSRGCEAIDYPKRGI